MQSRKLQAVSLLINFNLNAHLWVHRASLICFYFSPELKPVKMGSFYVKQLVGHSIFCAHTDPEV